MIQKGGKIWDFSLKKGYCQEIFVDIVQKNAIIKCIYTRVFLLYLIIFYQFGFVSGRNLLSIQSENTREQYERNG